MQDALKAVWSIPYVSVAFFPSLKHNFMAYRSSKVSYCFFEIHQLWQSGFIRVYSNCCCSCSFEAEIMKTGHSFHKMYSNNILNFQESTTILNAVQKVWKLIKSTTYLFRIWTRVVKSITSGAPPKLVLYVWYKSISSFWSDFVAYQMFFDI